MTAMMDGREFQPATLACVKSALGTEGWDEQRAAVFSELTCRGVRILDVDLGYER